MTRTKEILIVLLAMGVSFAFGDYTTPTANWKMDENANDSSGNGYNMTSVTVSYDAADHVGDSTASGVFNNSSNTLGIRPNTSTAT